jgi:hypothetical protein
MHSLHGGIIISWLACNVPAPLCRKVGTKDKEFPMIVSGKAWILEHGFTHIVRGGNKNQHPLGAKKLSIVFAILTSKLGIKRE